MPKKRFQPEEIIGKLPDADVLLGRREQLSWEGLPVWLIRGRQGTRKHLWLPRVHLNVAICMTQAPAAVSGAVAR